MAPVARIGRWMGALVVEAGGAQRLVGNPKEPCTFTPPVPLSAALEVAERDLDELAALVHARLVIQRNDSVSERLWRLVTHAGDTRADWLLDIPAHVWEIVRNDVLRCS
jgi:hypothetical protein